MKQRTILIAVLTAVLANVNVAIAQTPDSPEGRQAPPGRSALPQTVPELEAMAEQAIADQNGVKLLQSSILLRKQRPYEATYLANMVRAYALIDRPRSAYNYMLRMQQQGLYHDFNQYEETFKLRNTEVYDYVNDLLIRARTPAGEGETAFMLDESWSLPAGLAWDDKHKRFIVGTAADGVLLAVGEDGEVTELLRADEDNGLWSITDVEVDLANNRLWVSSASIPVFSGFDRTTVGRSALYEFELDTLVQVARYPVPVDGLPHELGPIAIAPSGDVYVADRLAPIVFLKPADEGEIVFFAANPELVSFRDMTISKDGSRIYVADVAKGVFVLDPVRNESVMLEGPETLNLGGIEGIFWADYSLIIIQSGIEPQRVMSLELDESGGKVESVRPMAIALEAFNDPSFGTIKGDALYYFANVQVPLPGEPAPAVTVLRTSLDAGHDIVPPDMMKFDDEILSKKRENQQQ